MNTGTVVLGKGRRYIFLDHRPHGEQSTETGHDCNVDCHETCHLFSLTLLRGTRKYIFLNDEVSQLKIGGGIFLAHERVS